MSWPATQTCEKQKAAQGDYLLANMTLLSSIVRLVIIEDSAPFARALEEYFRLESSGIQRVATYSTAEEALRGAPGDKADVALVDVNLPLMNGIECVARLKALNPSLTCLMLTMYEDTPVIFDALRSGACGYLLKRTPPAEIAAAVFQAHAGGAPMSPQIARHVVSFFHNRPAAEGLEVFTAREREVLELLSTGSLYKEIADRLGVSLDTVRTHLRNIYEKLHVHSRTEAVVKYLAKRG
jgi:DNA-binding NarL/FixJ family response regulator